MTPESELIHAEIPEIERIVCDESRLQGELRGPPVDRHDPAIQARVAEIVLTSVGARLRQELNLGHGRQAQSLAWSFRGDGPARLACNE